MHRPAVYIAAPYGAPTEHERRLNVARAALLGRLAVRMMLAPIVPHLGGEELFGPEDDPDLGRAHRQIALDCTDAILFALSFSTRAELWVLERADGSLSEGVAREVATWTRARRAPARRATWREWRVALEAHGLARAWAGLECAEIVASDMAEGERWCDACARGSFPDSCGSCRDCGSPLQETRPWRLLESSR